MKTATLFTVLCALGVSAAPASSSASASAAASSAAVTAAVSQKVAAEVVSAPPAAFTAATGAPGGPMPGAPKAAAGGKAGSPVETIKVTAEHLLGLNKNLFDGLLRDLLKPWFTDGKKEPMGDEEVQGWRPLAELVAASYCPITKVEDLTCGPACDDIAPRNMTWIDGGGDNQSNPQWFVVDDGARLILALEGTNFASVLSWANDVDFVPLPPQDAHFPDNNGAKIHRGFYSTFGRMIADIEAAFAPHLEARKQIVVTGHSQGAALGEIVTTYLIQKYPDHDVTGRVFAKPRVGDRAWANYVDSVCKGRFQFMQNNADIVGLLPPIEWAFRHPSGEVWIDGDDYFQCEGQENKNCIDSQRAIGWIPNVIIPTNELQAHIGPYIGVRMGLCGIY